jgi:hypothetical protein
MMTLVEFKKSCSETLIFVQQLIDKANLDLTAAWLTEDDFASLAKNHKSRLNWLNYFPHFLHEESFSAGFKVKGSQDVEGAFLAIYSAADKHLHLFMIESLVKDDSSHPLKGRLTTLAVIAMTDLLASIDDSVGAFIIQPDPDLIGHYSKFGFSYRQDKNVMYADFNALTSVQQNILRRSNLRVDW